MGHALLSVVLPCLISHGGPQSRSATTLNMASVLLAESNSKHELGEQVKFLN